MLRTIHWCLRNALSPVLGESEDEATYIDPSLILLMAVHKNYIYTVTNFREYLWAIWKWLSVTIIQNAMRWVGGAALAINSTTFVASW